jgi:hypothetical protein
MMGNPAFSSCFALAASPRTVTGVLQEISGEDKSNDITATKICHAKKIIT